jgi:hypothetical protein
VFCWVRVLVQAGNAASAVLAKFCVCGMTNGNVWHVVNDGCQSVAFEGSA